MKGDFSRWDPVRRTNLNGVLHQQGRVLLDRDWNDQTRLALDWQDVAGRDIIGPGVLAVPTEDADAFLVAEAEFDGDAVRLTLEPGRGWADGLLVYLDADSESAQGRRTARPFGPPVQPVPDDPGAAGTRDAVVLEVWRETLNGFQLPDPGLLEPALGGPDTTERVHTAFRFRLVRLGADDHCGTVADLVHDDPATRGRLRARLEPVTVSGDPCPVVTGGGYAGFEHHLVRVEIADADPPGAHFKWSAYNGGLVGRGRFRIDGTEKSFRIDANDQAIKTSGLDTFYLEVVRYDADAGHFRVTYGAEATLDGDRLVVGAEHFTADGDPPADRNVFFRLWNAIQPIDAFSGGATPLADGIELDFDPDTGANYRPGDYWTFEVRAGEIEQPDVLVDDRPPEGVRYTRVPVAILGWTGARRLRYDAGEITDCRDVFQPLTRRGTCCTFTVGDGVRSRGDFDRLEDAVRHLPKGGGRICLLPGRHQANVVLENRRDVRITGCGVHTAVHPRPEQTGAPIFRISGCRNIRIDNLAMLAAAGTAIEVFDTEASEQDTRGLHILDNTIVACEHAVRVRVDNGKAGENDIRIAGNRIGMLDKAGGGAAVFSQADGVVIERNRLVVVPPPDPDDPGDPRTDDPGGGDTVFDPCADPALVYQSDTAFYGTYILLLYYVAGYVADFGGPVYQTQGGIQIGGGSERVRVAENTIVGGAGNGITLGHLPGQGGTIVPSSGDTVYMRSFEEERRERFVSSLYEIDLSENTIVNMGLSGIGPAAFFDPEEARLAVRVERLTIYRNTILRCTRQIPAELLAELRTTDGLSFGSVAFGGVVLAICAHAVIQENRIEGNGADHRNPTCGVFIQHGREIDVSHNRILGNGFAEHDDVERGTRGGIVVGGAAEGLGGLFGKQKVRQGLGLKLRPEGVPAVRIHGNVVFQPHGQALALFTLGPVSVVGNQFTTQGSDYRVNPLSLLAGSVFILNLGLSRDLLPILLPGFRNVFLMGYDSYGKAPMKKEADTGLLQVLFAWPSGSVVFADNRTTLDLRAQDVDFTLTSQAIVSLDDVGFHGNVSECAALFDVVLLNTFLGAFSVRANDNRFTDGLTFTFYSLLSFGLLNTATGNQASNCLLVAGGRTIETNNLVINNERCEDQ